MGSNTEREIARQADPEVNYLMSIYQNDDGDFDVTFYVCVCGLKVIALNDDNDYKCDHCDNPCYAGACRLCKKMMQEE